MKENLPVLSQYPSKEHCHLQDQQGEDPVQERWEDLHKILMYKVGLEIVL